MREWSGANQFYRWLVRIRAPRLVPDFGPLPRARFTGRQRKARAIDRSITFPDDGATHGSRVKMATDLQELEQVLQTYFDGLYEGDAAKLAAVFHAESHLFSVTDGKLDDLPRERWFEVVRNRPSARSRDLPRRDWVVSIDRSGPTTAFAKVQCQIPPRYFTDYLTFVKLADGWRIISKTFHTDTR
jgi:hypothetical protein